MVAGLNRRSAILLGAALVLVSSHPATGIAQPPTGDSGEAFRFQMRQRAPVLKPAAPQITLPAPAAASAAMLPDSAPRGGSVQAPRAAAPAPAAPGPNLGGDAGPPNFLVYVNDQGKFVIGPGANYGMASYLFRNERHFDILEYEGYGVMHDRRSDAGPEVAGWVYQASDQRGNRWWLFFGEHPLRQNWHSTPRYPIYYSLVDPERGDFRRWLTQSGTSRF